MGECCISTHAISPIACSYMAYGVPSLPAVFFSVGEGITGSYYATHAAGRRMRGYANWAVDITAIAFGDSRSIIGPCYAIRHPDKPYAGAPNCQNPFAA